MLRVTPSQNADAAKQYFGKSMVRSDYYSEGQEIAGAWGGLAAERLGLSGQVDQESYFALCDNLDPRTKEKLTPRQKSNRRAGYDFTFSTPKSVSVLYELSGDERILNAFRDSVKETMSELETEMKTRVRKNGKDEDRLTGNMVWSEFVHFTSRPVDGKPDPHLHAHVFVHNVTFDESEGRWKAGQFGDLKRDAPYYEAAFDARFAHRLNAMGYATEREGLSFEVAGVPKSVIDKFSRRRDDIEEKAAEKNITTPEGKHAIGYYGRENKKSGVGNPKVDEAQDGGRAVVVEEGLSAWIFARSKELNYFDGQKRLSFDLLKTVQQFISGYEVEACPLSLWEIAILKGYEVFRQVKSNLGGTIVCDRTARTVEYRPLGGNER